MVSLNKALENIKVENIKMIKIDTEGAELPIFRGAVDILAKYNVPYIICEMNHFGFQQMGYTEDELRSFLSELGYHAYFYNESNLTKLQPGQYIKSETVFNLFFIKEGVL
jgi:hypothetical protein